MITVIGGGPAGRFAASYLAGAGEKVRIIEKSGNLGGQCLKYGCMVTCGLNDAARNLNQLARLQKLQVLNSAELRVSLPNLWKELGAIQNTIFKVLDNEADLAGIEVITGEVRLSGRDIYLNGNLLPQGDGDKILIATGSYPIIPQIKGIDLKGVFNPHTLQSMKAVPKNLLIIGGGVIAAEYAYIFSQFGSKVTMACRSAFLRDKPERLIKCARKEISDVSIREYTLVEELKSEEGSDSKGFVAYAVLKSGKNREEIPCDAVIIASGLRPRTDNIKGIALDDAGAVIVDDSYMTNVDGVYAAGDVTGKVFLTPYARMQGIAAAKSIIGEKVTKIPEYIPQSVKLFYEHTFCNMDSKSDTENSVRELSLPAPAGPGSIWSVSERYTGISSIRVDAESGTVKGIHLSSPSSGTVGAYLAYLMEKTLNVKDFETFLEVHPSTDGLYMLVKYGDTLLTKETK
ncbi:MAG: NAD(P)/FAD-dependent oxidoreductase [Methanomicrobium sp.]|nr:NAD(P)/FAD-dependent oxidoreductase [Methanomicrobium sp.]